MASKRSPAYPAISNSGVCAGPAGVGGGADPEEGDVVGGGVGEGVLARFPGEEVAAVVDGDVVGVRRVVPVDVRYVRGGDDF